MKVFKNLTSCLFFILIGASAFANNPAFEMHNAITSTSCVEVDKTVAEMEQSFEVQVLVSDGYLTPRSLREGLGLISSNACTCMLEGAPMWFMDEQFSEVTAFLLGDDPTVASDEVKRALMGLQNQCLSAGQQKFQTWFQANRLK